MQREQARLDAGALRQTLSLGWGEVTLAGGCTDHGYELGAVRGVAI